MKRAAARTLLLAFPAALLACGPSGEGARTPPVTAAKATPAPSAAATATTSKGPGYAGHGAESVPAEVIAKFAPTPLPGDVSRRIQAMLDVRAPIGSWISPDGKTLSSGGADTTVLVWKLDTP